MSNPPRYYSYEIELGPNLSELRNVDRCFLVKIDRGNPSGKHPVVAAGTFRAMVTALILFSNRKMTDEDRAGLDRLSDIAERGELRAYIESKAGLLS